MSPLQPSHHTMSNQIPRAPLREHVRRVLVKRLISGELEPEHAINESELASELGISRSPLREALVGLEYEGLVDSTPGKGFTVAPLEAEMAKELYELAGDLEALALDKSPIPDITTLDKLQELDQERKTSNGIERAVELDETWHDTLLAECPNSELLRLIDQVRLQLHRYIVAFHTDPDQHAQALRHHHNVLSALREDDLEEAAKQLKQHWLYGIEALQTANI